MKLKDSYTIKDNANLKSFIENSKGTPVKTRIIIKDRDTGEILSDNHNKILISGGQMTACKHFGLDAIVNLPNYNEDLGLENTLDYETVQPANEPIICLFCVGQGGGGTTPTDVYPVKYTERIEPDDMLPFRYVDEESDLNDDLRKTYLGRYTDSDGMIRYMFKAFDTEPQLHMRYLDGTQITDALYSIDSDQAAECYVEMRLRITRLDFRDYFEQVLGWDNAFINSLSLCFAWYDDTIDDYIWYQQITPFSKLNFPTEFMVDLNKAIDIIYQVYY